MSKLQHAVFDAIVVEEQARFTFEELCRVCGAQRSHVLVLVEEGVLEPEGSGPDDWQFEGPTLRRALSATRLAKDFELTPSSTALVLDLLQQIAHLRAQMKRAGIV